jgi:inosine-uridine nucleoside N-ribohydrolase
MLREYGNIARHCDDGWVDSSGRADPEVEHNFECDPVATKIVMDSAIPKVLIPVDLTLEFPMTDEFQALFHES